LGIGPAVLIGYALYASRGEQITIAHKTVSSLVFSVAVGFTGPVLYWLVAGRLARRRLAAAPATD
jgi:hypothetical protein